MRQFLAMRIMATYRYDNYQVWWKDQDLKQMQQPNVTKSQDEYKKYIGSSCVVKDKAFTQKFKKSSIGNDARIWSSTF